VGKIEILITATIKKFCLRKVVPNNFLPSIMSKGRKTSKSSLKSQIKFSVHSTLFKQSPKPTRASKHAHSVSEHEASILTASPPPRHSLSSRKVSGFHPIPYTRYTTALHRASMSFIFLPDCSY